MKVGDDGYEWNRNDPEVEVKQCDQCRFVRPCVDVGSEMICKPCHDDSLEVRR